MKMDKYELVLDIVEHSDNYTSEQLAEILSDPETEEIYNLLCKADTAVEANKEVNVDAEWEVFSKRYAVRPRNFFMWFGSRAASIAAIISTSVVAVAVTVAVIGHKAEQTADNGMEESAPSVASDSITMQTDTVKVDVTPIMFEDESLEAIMKKVAAVYGVEVVFRNKEVASLHLYYKLTPTLPLDEVVSQLNTFEQINIKRNGNTLTID